MEDLFIITKYSFVNHPQIKVDNINKPNWERSNFNILGKKINLKSIHNHLNFKINLKQRYCTGYYDLDSKNDHPCTDMQKINIKFLCCYKCQKKTAFIPIYNNSQPDDYSIKQQRYNLETHYIYLAYFGENLIKVGTSHYTRLSTRLKEQGALLGIIITKCKTGYESKLIETKISKYFGIPEIITTKRKINSLLNLSKNNNNTTLQNNTIQNYRQQNLFFTKQYFCSNLTYEDKDHSILSPKVLLNKKKEILNCFSLKEIDNYVYNFNDVYFLNNSIPSNLIFLDKFNEIEGVVIGMVGNLLIIKYQNKNYIISIKKFLGLISLSLKN